MLLVPTRVATSTIEGLGLFAERAIARGEEIWRYEPGLDLLIAPQDVGRYGEAFRTFLDRYGYVAAEFPDRIVLSCDHAKFMNHSPDPNVESRGFVSVAARDIAHGEELTCDYHAFAVGFEGFGEAQHS